MPRTDRGLMERIALGVGTFLLGVLVCLVAIVMTFGERLGEYPPPVVRPRC